MTHADLARFEADQARLLRPWLKKALALIDTKVSDAHAHAAKAVTDTLKQTPDGRATVRRAAQGRSTQAACNRLDELWDAMCGPTSASNSGLIRDARAIFYEESFERWKPFIPEELWVKDNPGPTAAGINEARTAPVHGYDVRQEFAVPIDRAKRSLQAAIVRCGHSSTPEHVATDILEGWAERARQSLFRVARSSLSDGQKVTETKAGRDLVHPDYLEELTNGEG